MDIRKSFSSKIFGGLTVNKLVLGLKCHSPFEYESYEVEREVAEK